MSCGDEFGRFLVCAGTVIAKQKIKNKTGIRRFRRIIGLPLTKSSTRFVGTCQYMPEPGVCGLHLAPRSPKERNAGEQASVPHESFFSAWIRTATTPCRSPEW